MVLELFQKRNLLFTPSYSDRIDNVASVPLWADDTLRSHGTPYLVHAVFIFSQWAISDADPMITTALALGFLLNNWK